MSQIARSTTNHRRRLEVLKQIAFWMLVLLFFRVVFLVVIEYRNYFPANFESNFLSGREANFFGLYRSAFYAHIISGPFCLLIAAFLMFSGKKRSLGKWHRWLGKTLSILVLLVMLPSGFIMATQAFTGLIAGISFYLLTLITAFCVGIASWHASQRRFAIHQLWATRSFILLCSPLLLRLMTGATIVSGFENEWTYRFAAWGSWLIPLTVFEIRRQQTQRSRFRSSKEVVT